MKAVQVKQPGGPEAMEVVEIEKPAPGPKQALVRIVASGVNFIDVYFRIGLYKADLPMTLGSEGAGIVEAVGPGVSQFNDGDEVYGVTNPQFVGANAEYAIASASMIAARANPNRECRRLSAGPSGAARRLTSMTTNR